MMKIPSISSWGYSVAGERLKKQLEDQNIPVDGGASPLCVHSPAASAALRAGVTYGLKQAFGDAVHCFFTEPTHACCMLLGMATGLHDGVSVKDFGIDGRTEGGRPGGGTPLRLCGPGGGAGSLGHCHH